MPFEPGQTATPDRLRRGVVGEALVTVNQTGIGAGPTDLTSFTRTITSPGGRTYKISTNFRGAVATGTTGWTIDVHRNAVFYRTIGIIEADAAGRDQCSGFVTDSPAAGTYTYKLVATRYGGGGTLDIETAGGVGGSLLIEDITP